MGENRVESGGLNQLGIILAQNGEIRYIDSHAREILEGMGTLDEEWLRRVMEEGEVISRTEYESVYVVYPQDQPVYLSCRKVDPQRNVLLVVVENSIHSLLPFFMEELLDELCIMDRQGVVRWVSQSWLQMHKVSASDVIGVSAVRLEKTGVFKPSVTLEVLRQKRRIEMVQYNKDGERILVSGVPIFDRTGEIIWVISYSSWDITSFTALRNKYSALKNLAEQYSAEVEALRSQSMEIPDLVADSPQMKKLLGLLRRVADKDISLLITGETGVGKSLFAKTVHRMSKRSKGPFIEINCGAIPENLLESELFGYKKGAFTGANREGKVGLIELANHGTLFLDEIGEMSLPLQVKLLRTLQEKEITRLGDTASIKVDFRLIAATNKDLKKMVGEDTFRIDLYYRISGVPILIPPIRERPEDLESMIHTFLFNLNKKYQTKKILSPQAQQMLMSYGWPGNVRELENVLEQIVVTSGEDYITPVHMPGELILNPDVMTESSLGLREAMERYEGKIIMSAYEKYKSTVGVSKALHISQPTAARKISKYMGLFKHE